ncbi:pre-60S ribosomal particles component [Ophidiomyces ophidiicola]|uniref:Pre-60S ribosomal particles component n=1 Tax=Ophidiomyces ophidiicola TaxID=1387563 RepID=A0ACB8V3V1_9EURO|nr:pre-60S ribosomal particles component [Ophidiomyces ophidiicola]KAI1928950.1 pre-60S ribosomal particles component [Ophidiomyces ophidiicola]KAI1952302.1 pre-60S ribosomal particles component [Ophidiomyces ophidiicola]KAI1956262.1 pre-60S ribosomal particles component [Ophidiomyces ophidiicola]KAI1970141.1 pre-60S ribosomal particles component [Ophidiomyces ophidiicola]
MAPSIRKKRALDDAVNPRASRPKKKFKKQLDYNSSSSEDEPDPPVTIVPGTQDSDENKSSAIEIEEPEHDPTDLVLEKDNSDVSNSENESDSSADSGSSSVGSHTYTTKLRKQTSKRNDPASFSTSMIKILGTKLPSSARADPLLSRSKSTAQTTADIANEKLEKRARAKLRAEKKEELDRGRVTDVLGVERGEAGETAEQEKRLRKIAQRGVVKLFNAVRAAQVRGEEVAREERSKRATVGMDEREKKINEVSKQGFLELINGKGGERLAIEEA